jgi:HEAT repeat protein
MHFRVVISLLITASAARAAAPPERVDVGRVEQLVARLDDDSFDVRQEADERLRDMGKAVVGLLKDRMANPSLEVRARLRRIIHDLTIDQRVAGLTRQLADGDAATRERAGWALRKAGPCVVPLLRRELNAGMPAEQRRRVETILTELAAGR